MFSLFDLHKLNRSCLGSMYNGGALVKEVCVLASGAYMRERAFKYLVIKSYSKLVRSI
jgi:hypothetical protein